MSSTVNLETIADRIKYALEYRGGLSQAWLARYSGLTEGRISQILRGNGSTSAEGLFRIADALHVEPRWLATGEGPMESRKAS